MICIPVAQTKSGIAANAHAPMIASAVRIEIIPGKIIYSSITHIDCGRPRWRPREIRRQSIKVRKGDNISIAKKIDLESESNVFHRKRTLAIHFQSDASVQPAISVIFDQRHV